MLHSFHWSTHLTFGCYTTFVYTFKLLKQHYHSFHWSTHFTIVVVQLQLVHSAHHWVAMLHSFHWSTQLTTGWPCYTAFTGPLSSPLGGPVTQLSLVHSDHHWVAGWPCRTAFTGPLSWPLGGCVAQLSLVHSAHHWVAVSHSFWLSSFCPRIPDKVQYKLYLLSIRTT